MIDKQLNIGDHIVDADGHIYVIEAVNKASYRARRIDGGYTTEAVPFNGMQRLYGNTYEYFICEDAQLKIIENLNKKNDELQKELKEQEQSIIEARTFKENLEWLLCNKLSDLEQHLDDDYDD